MLGTPILAQEWAQSGSVGTALKRQSIILTQSIILSDDEVRKLQVEAS